MLLAPYKSTQLSSPALRACLASAQRDAIFSRSPAPQDPNLYLRYMRLSDGRFRRCIVGRHRYSSSSA